LARKFFWREQFFGAQNFFISIFRSRFAAAAAAAAATAALFVIAAAGRRPS